VTIGGLAGAKSAGAGGEDCQSGENLRERGAPAGSCPGFLPPVRRLQGPLQKKTVISSCNDVIANDATLQ
jgi:hypothetical protein